MPGRTEVLQLYYGISTTKLEWGVGRPVGGGGRGGSSVCGV